MHGSSSIREEKNLLRQSSISLAALADSIAHGADIKRKFFLTLAQNIAIFMAFFFVFCCFPVRYAILSHVILNNTIVTEIQKYQTSSFHAYSPLFWRYFQPISKSCGTNPGAHLCRQRRTGVFWPTRHKQGTYRTFYVGLVLNWTCTSGELWISIIPNICPFL